MIMNRNLLRLLALALFVLSTFSSSWAEEQCSTQQEIDAATRSAIEASVQQFYSQASQGNTEAMRANAIPGVAGSFDGIANAVQGDKEKIAGGQAHIKGVWLLNAPGTQNYERAEFFCGLFNSPQRTSFVIPNLPPGKYSVAIQEITGSKVPFTITYVLEEMGGQWKLAGYQAHPHQVGPHDGLWYWVQARDLKKQGQQDLSFFYYVTAANLLVPVPFMSTPQFDKLYDEQQNSVPGDLPKDPHQPVPLNLNGKTYQIVQAFPVADDKQGLDLVYKYAVQDISNQPQTFQENVAFIKALVAQHPEYKQAFTAIVARAVAPSGQDFGTMLPVTDIK
jgi:hypothetical protein